MPLNIIRNDITKVKADAIVNTANPEPVIGGGTDSAIYVAAGKDKLLAARRLIGRIAPGQAIETAAYNLDARFIIHTVCTVWTGRELDILADCYHNSLVLAKELGCKSVAFPLIGTGSYGFPRGDAIGVARDIITRFLEEQGDTLDVMLVVFDSESLNSARSISSKIKSYIDDVYVKEASAEEYSVRRERVPSGHIIGKSFCRRVFEYADNKGIKDSELYGGKYELYFSKQVLSKMRSDPDYHPSKYVCIVICLVLDLDINDALDLMESAGYTLSRSRIADCVVRGCIINGIRDYYRVNEELKANGCAELKQIK